MPWIPIHVPALNATMWRQHSASTHSVTSRSITASVNRLFETNIKLGIRIASNMAPCMKIAREILYRCRKGHVYAGGGDRQAGRQTERHARTHKHRHACRLKHTACGSDGQGSTAARPPHDRLTTASRPPHGRLTTASGKQSVLWNS